MLQEIGPFIGLMQLEHRGRLSSAQKPSCRSEREAVVTFKATHTGLPTCVRANLQWEGTTDRSICNLADGLFCCLL